MHRRTLICSLAAALLTGAEAAQADPPPQALSRQLPPGYDVLSFAVMSFRTTGHSYYIVALGKLSREASARRSSRAPARPLVVFERRRDGSFLRAGRNDSVILRADEGGQCDPFLDGGGVIAVKGRYFTVENGVACGSHWTDYVTFRFDDGVGQYVFDNERSQSWSLNSGADPNADALVPDSAPEIGRGDLRRPVTLDHWQRAR